MSTRPVESRQAAPVGSDRRAKGQSQAAGARSSYREWVWLRLDDFAEGLCAEPFEPVIWPSQEGDQRVWAHLIQHPHQEAGRVPGADRQADG